MPSQRKSISEICKYCLKYLQKLTADWKPYIEQPTADKDLSEVMTGASIPSFGFFLLMLLSTIIATLGLLQNSAPAIIGAMIIAPLMTPIISLAYSVVKIDWRLARRSILTIIFGVLIVVLVAYLSTRIIGIRIAGSEILSRTSPTLLDLGIAMAAGAAAAFSYTRKSIINSIAGVAVAVALVPPLTVTGIGLAYGRLAASDAGLSLTELGHYSGGVDIARGSFILFLTNLIGIVFVACLILLSQGYGSWKKAGAGLIAILLASILIINPLEKALYKLTVKSKVLSLMVTLPQKYPHMFSGQGKIDGIHVNYRGDDILHVSIDGFTPKPKEVKGITERMDAKLRRVVDVFQKHLEKELGTPVIVEVDLIPVEIISAKSGGEEFNPAGYQEPETTDPDDTQTNQLQQKKN